MQGFLYIELNINFLKIYIIIKKSVKEYKRVNLEIEMLCCSSVF